MNKAFRNLVLKIGVGRIPEFKEMFSTEKTDLSDSPNILLDSPFNVFFFPTHFLYCKI